MRSLALFVFTKGKHSGSANCIIPSLNQCQSEAHNSSQIAKNVPFILQFPPEGALLQGGEQGVEFGELRAHPCLLRFHLFDDGREAVLEGRFGRAALVVFKAFKMNIFNSLKVVPLES